MDWHKDREYEVYEVFVKDQEEKKKRKQELEEKAFEFKYSEWREGKSKEFLLEIVPEGQFVSYGQPGYEMELKGYYRNNIWEEHKKEMIEK